MDVQPIDDDDNKITEKFIDKILEQCIIADREKIKESIEVKSFYGLSKCFFSKSDYRIYRLSIRYEANNEIKVLCTSKQTFGDIKKLIKGICPINEGYFIARHPKKIDDNDFIDQIDFYVGWINHIFFFRSPPDLIPNSIPSSQNISLMPLPGILSNNSFTNSNKQFTSQNLWNVKPITKKICEKMPAATKIKVWDTYFGLPHEKCYCCKTSLINPLNFAIGHIISKHCGGSNDLSNLRPICTTCNSSMGTKNMKDFMLEKGLGQLE